MFTEAAMMKLLTIPTVLLLVLPFAPTGARTRETVESEDAAAVRRCFAMYKDTLIRQKGDEAAKWVTKSTIDYYGELREVALYGSEEEVRKLSALKKMSILTLRHRVGADSLLKMSAADVWAHGVGQGWSGRNSLQDVEIGKIEFENDAASVEVLVRGRPSRVKYRFVKEDGAWKMDVLSRLAASEQGMARMVRNQKIEEDEFLIDLLEMTSFTPVPETIWQPPMKRIKN